MAPTHIREAYKIYWTLKTLALETNLVDVTIESAQDALDAKTTVFEMNINSDTNLSGSSNSEFCTVISEASVDNNGYEKRADHSSQVNINEEKLQTVNSEENITDNNAQYPKQNEDSVWGSHLSKKSNAKILGSAIWTHQYTAKLFAGAKFNKRNPRKVMYRKSDSESQSTQNFSASDSLKKSDSSTLHLSQSSQLPYGMENLDNSNISVVNESDKTSDLYQNSLNKRSLTMVTCDTHVLINQPLSILQKTLFHDADANYLIPRSFDTGWIERVTKQVSVEHQQKLVFNESEFELNEKSQESLNMKQMDKVAESDEDFVYDSDLESEKYGNIPNSSQSSGKRTLDNIEPKEYTVSKKVKIDLEGRATEEKCNINEVNTSIDDCFNEASKVSNYNRNNLKKVKNISKKLIEREILKKKVESGKANENFVKINIKKKVYARGKKTMTFLKYKKQKRKTLRKPQNNEMNFSSRAILTCFKCGDIGHISRNCLKG